MDVTGVDGASSGNFPSVNVSYFASLPDPNVTNPTPCGPVNQNSWGGLTQNTVGFFYTSGTKQTYTLPSFSSQSAGTAYLIFLASGGGSSPTGNNQTLINKITIIESPATSFNVSPVRVSKTCGTTLTQTFTVNGSGIPSGATVSYLWNFGSTSSGWLLNGSPAPQTVTTTTNTLTLSIAACDNGPSNVAVTAIVNGTNYNAGTISATVGTPSYYINGPSTICLNTPGNYSITNLSCGSATVNWSASPSGIVSIASPNAQQTSISYITYGNVTLTASINSCGQLNTQTMQVRAGGYSSGDYPVSGPTTVCTSQPNVAYNTNTLVGATNYAWFWPGDWTYISGQGTPHLLLNAGTNIGTVQIGVRVANACDAGGSPGIANVQVNSCGYAVMAAPNPATSTMTISVKQPSSTFGQTTKAVKIYQLKITSQSGIPRKQLDYPVGVTKTTINLSDLTPGIYFLHAFNGAQWSSLQIIKQ